MKKRLFIFVSSPNSNSSCVYSIELNRSYSVGGSLRSIVGMGMVTVRKEEKLLPHH